MILNSLVSLILSVVALFLLFTIFGDVISFTLNQDQNQEISVANAESIQTFTNYFTTGPYSNIEDNCYNFLKIKNIEDYQAEDIVRYDYYIGEDSIKIVEHEKFSEFREDRSLNNIRIEREFEFDETFELRKDITNQGSIPLGSLAFGQADSEVELGEELEYIILRPIEGGQISLNTLIYNQNSFQVFLLNKNGRIIDGDFRFFREDRQLEFIAMKRSFDKNYLFVPRHEFSASIAVFNSCEKLNLVNSDINHIYQQDVSLIDYTNRETVKLIYEDLQGNNIDNIIYGWINNQRQCYRLNEEEQTISCEEVFEEELVEQLNQIQNYQDFVSLILEKYSNIEGNLVPYELSDRTIIEGAEYFVRFEDFFQKYEEKEILDMFDPNGDRLDTEFKQSIYNYRGSFRDTANSNELDEQIFMHRSVLIPRIGQIYFYLPDSLAPEEGFYILKNENYLIKKFYEQDQPYEIYLQGRNLGNLEEYNVNNRVVGFTGDSRTLYKITIPDVTIGNELKDIDIIISKSQRTNMNTIFHEEVGENE